MAVQQLTKPILNPIAAFDATQAETVEFTVIGGAQVIANRLVISNNQTGAQVYNQIQSTMKLEHTIPAGTLENGVYYNAVIYTINNGNEESEASTAIPFYCYSTPTLTITNIPDTETIENGTYAFIGNYSQVEDERLNSYQFTLYDSNKDVLTQSPLIYYDTDSSLSYTFRGMNNDAAYYIEITGETVNGTSITSGLMYFTIRYQQPASFAICDLVNNCSNGYIQISSNIVAIDGTSNPEPPTYIDDKEVDLRDKDAWVEWSSGFRIQDNFTMRVWGRQFTPYETLTTLTNDLNSDEKPNKIELKWMIGDVVKSLPSYTKVDGYNENITDSEATEIKNLSIGGESNQVLSTAPSVEHPSTIYSVGDKKNLISIDDFDLQYDNAYYTATNTNFALEPNNIYTLSFNYYINDATTDVYYSLGYGTTEYGTDISSIIQYQTQNSGRNSVTFTVPSTVESGNYLWVKFAQTIILANVDVQISNIQLEKGSTATDYQSPNSYEIYPLMTNRNLYKYGSALYLKKNNSIVTEIANGYNIKVSETGTESSVGIGWKNILYPGKQYTISYSQLGQFDSFKLYKTNKDSQDTIEEIAIVNNTFTAPDGLCDLQLVFSVDNSSASNYIEIWNIQIEASSSITEYEPQLSNGSTIVLDEPLRGIGNYKDLVCLTSPNLLDSSTQSAIAEGSTTYYLNQVGSTTYYLWYYNEEGNLITFTDSEGKESHGAILSKGTFTTHEQCAKITITKSNDAEAGDVTADEIISNQIDIVLGENPIIYYPFASQPSLIRYFESKALNGTEDWALGTAPTQTNTLYFTLANSQTGLDSSIVNCMADIFTSYNADYLYANDVEGIAQSQDQIMIRVLQSRSVSDLATFKTFLGNHNVTGAFRVFNPTIETLGDSNSSALQGLTTYTPITNAFTNNNVLGNMKFEYVSGYTEQQTQNAYLLLKCWSANTMPYVMHSNYIDIPGDNDKVFVWMRRKDNLFDLIIENLGDYSESEKPIDESKPIVSIEINQAGITSTTIPVTMNALDENGLKTVRFSKNNGQSWDEVITVDGLSTTQSYTFTGLKSDTIYTIRCEAIDISGNVGGISQNARTSAS